MVSEALPRRRLRGEASALSMDGVDGKPGFPHGTRQSRTSALTLRVFLKLNLLRVKRGRADCILGEMTSIDRLPPSQLALE
jgi:hypothetical protein